MGQKFNLTTISVTVQGDSDWTDEQCQRAVAAANAAIHDALAGVALPRDTELIIDGDRVPAGV